MHAIFRGVSVIPVLTIDRERDAVPLARALFEGGLPVIEVTMRTAAAGAAVAAIRRELAQVVVGAGTLLRAADVATAIQAGAGFLVSPGLTPELAAAAWQIDDSRFVLRPGGTRPRHLCHEILPGGGAWRCCVAQGIGAGLSRCRVLSDRRHR